MVKKNDINLSGGGGEGRGATLGFVSFRLEAVEGFSLISNNWSDEQRCDPQKTFFDKWRQEQL